MYQMMIKATFAFAMMLSGFAHAGIVIESTRYLYKEGVVRYLRKLIIKTKCLI